MSPRGSNFRRPHPSPRLDDTGRVLGTCFVTALLARGGRHPNMVRKHCEPVACDVATRQLLYDVAESERVLASKPARYDRRRV